MKKILYIMASVLEIVLVLGAYIFNYFTNSKIGMARFVIFMNQGWQAKYPLETLRMVAVAVIAVLTMLLLVLFIKKKEKMALKIRLSTVVMAVLSFGYIGLTLLSSVDKMKAYYFVSLMLGLAALIQIGKVFIKFMRQK